ncbi:MAG: Flp pilus assembly protein CpaB [Hyphomicrobiales bacterium]|nr:Flp pilus assembly protein CpaB [Hyphomicrobiales bacterium]
MKKAQIAVLLIALGAGGAAAYMAASSLGGPPEVIVSEPVANTELDEVLVAGRDIPLGFGISAADLTWQPWPKEATVANFILRSNRPDAIEEVSGAIARSPFLNGEPIKEGKLVRSDRGFMSAILPKGMRAVSTEISPETGAGGFILPNDFVDVILTRRRNTQAAAQGSEQAFVTETVLANVRVLAIDQTVEEQDGEKVVVGKTATLELTPSQAEVLALADQLGELSLSLRSLKDAGESAGGPQTDEFFLKSGGRKRGGVTIVKYGIAGPASSN